MYHRCTAAWRPAIQVALVTAWDVVQCALFPHGAAIESGCVDLENLPEGNLGLGNGRIGVDGVGVKGKKVVRGRVEERGGVRDEEVARTEVRHERVVVRVEVRVEVVLGVVEIVARVRERAEESEERVGMSTLVLVCVVDGWVSAGVLVLVDVVEMLLL